MRSIYKIIFETLFILNALCWCICTGRPFLMKSRTHLLKDGDFPSANSYITDSSFNPLLLDDNDDDDMYPRGLDIDLMDSPPYTRTAIFSKLYQWALQEVGPQGYVSRNKRPGGRGVLGLDNIDFAASTLDRARGRTQGGGAPNLPLSFGGGGGNSKGGMLPMRMRPKMQGGRQGVQSSGGMSMSSGGSDTEDMATGQRRLSVDVSVGDLRKMLDMIKAGR